MRFVFVTFVCLFVLVFFYSCDCMRLPLLQFCVSCYMRVLIARVLGFRAFGLFVCACMIGLRVIVYSVVFVCCKVAFQITRMCRLHVFVCLFVCVCMLVMRVVA